MALHDRITESNIEHMSYDDAFDLGRRVTRPLPSEFASASGLTPAGAVARLRAIAAEANRLEAERHAVLSQLYLLRDDGRAVRAESNRRFVDDWDELIAECGAALGVGRGAASAAVHRAIDLRERFPRVFELFARGAIGMPQVRAVLRTAIAVLDDEVAAALDGRIAGWFEARLDQPGTVLTGPTVEQAATTILTRLDREAVPEKPSVAPAARLEFHARTDGAVDLEVVMSKAEGIRLSKSIAEMVQTVCRNDGRTSAQRQVAALVALAEGYETLGCQCPTENCPNREARPRNGAVAQQLKALAVIVLNESDAVASGSPAPESAEPGGAVVLTDDPGISGPVTAAQARALIDSCATSVRVLGRRDPVTGKIHVRGASGYRPTQYQLLVLRLTYPTCTFPGCSVPSSACQIDHVTEYDHHESAAGGRTEIGNLVPLCGFHHRIKTETGWLSDVLPDGGVEWHHPTGATWVVPPGSARDLFPGLGTLAWDTSARDTEREDRGAERPTSGGFGGHARRRAAQRRRLRAMHRRLRHLRAARKTQEQEAALREAASSLGHEPDSFLPAAPPF
ncbi:HNH endonuclease OS=Tsukamurella paurometabola (strain ATCC 8368 / DSM / CCUG 35730 / CIP 100753/ JCM 10117 / KCTC 9821 / NBRC 16120 / NCIMB 702349 / NCTC 13040) OX=521096 GN=Tpau_0807 PE=4 SV=1 [Tsukamurella paurometabola]|uniref:HNH endonuclease n=2 Tax=Tsukamurella paurometabola TaxID=2061 RepID=D5UTT9_TSUPD|nr:HNH endonuclease [Tsukamurella paurometabola DSM 20162]SUP27065.1 Uncharacterised protein [Tsukamurella paurometabola]